MPKNVDIELSTFNIQTIASGVEVKDDIVEVSGVTVNMLNDFQGRDSPFHPTNRHHTHDTTTSPPDNSKDETNDIIFGCIPISRGLRWTIVDSLQRSLPMTRSVPSQQYFYIVSMILLAMLAIFVVFFSIGYNNGLNTTFLSPVDQNTGDTSSSSYCSSVLTTNTGTYLATIDGYWQNSPYFQYANASYLATVTSFSISYDAYVSLMNKVYQDVSMLGQSALHNPLQYNLIYWMSAMFLVPNTITQRFYLIGNPQVVFNRQHTAGILTSVHGPCSYIASSTSSTTKSPTASPTTMSPSVSPTVAPASNELTVTTTYDFTSASLSLTYNYQEYLTYANCYEAANPLYLGYVPTINTNVFTIKIDVRSLVTAIAVNIGVLSMEDLVLIPGFTSTYPYNNTIYSIEHFYNSKFPSMTPIICMKSQGYSEYKPFGYDNIFLCGFAYGTTYTLPIFNTMGANYTYPIPCSCANAAELDLNNAYAPCNMFNLLAGFVFWDTNIPDPLFELLGRYNYNYSQVNNDAFDASFIDSYWGLTSPNFTYLQSPSFREQAYSFCKTSYGTCSIMLFSSFDDDVQATWAISEYYYILQYGACRDTITPSYGDWQKLIVEPFAPLTESYEECHYSPMVLFFNQMGIAMGTVNLLSPICALLIITTFYQIQQYFWKKTDDKTNNKKVVLDTEDCYSRVELDRANYSLALALLMARDAKLHADPNAVNSSSPEHLSQQMEKDLQVLAHPRIQSLIQQLAHELTTISELQAPVANHQHHHANNKNSQLDRDTFSPMSNHSHGNTKQSPSAQATAATLLSQETSSASKTGGTIKYGVDSDDDNSFASKH